MDLPNDGKRYEIHDGELSVTPVPGTRHQELSLQLASLLFGHVTSRALGKVYSAPVDVILDRRTVLQPDIVFVDRARLGIVAEHGIEGAPTLVIALRCAAHRRCAGEPAALRGPRARARHALARGVNMGTFRVAIEIGDPTGTRWLEVEALVDTGATYTSLPTSILDDLGVVPHLRAAFLLADGREVQRDVGRTWIRADGRAEMTLVVFGEPGTPALLGAYALEGLRFAADPVGRRLVPVPGLLMAG